jgi:hypothetical protein
MPATLVAASCASRLPDSADVRSLQLIEILQAVPAFVQGGVGAELRGLAISYRERIELLKPILTALKEEIANRNR